MRNDEYIILGKCIWCLKTKPEVQFKTKAHTIPKSLNCHNIGVDICDSCNNHFGTDKKDSYVSFSIDKIIKEFFNIHKFLLSGNKNSNSWKKLNSQFFTYFHSSNQLKIKIDYRHNSQIVNEYTRRFKRGIYNIFLQEYHRVTHDGHNKKFDEIRSFVRNNLNELPVYYLVSNNGIRVSEDLDKNFELTFNDNVRNIIEHYGFYHFSMTGLNFYLEVTNEAKNHRETYLLNDAKAYIGSGFIFNNLIELKNINQIDFTLNKWNTYV